MSTTQHAVHPDALELAELLRPTWATITRSLRATGAPVCEGDPAGEDPAANGDPAGEDPAANGDPAGGGSDRTFTQADLERIVKDRLARQKAQFADYDDLKSAAGRLKEFQDAQKTELEREREKAAEAEARATKATERAQAVAIRAEVLKEAAKQAAVDPDVVYELLDKQKVTIGDDDQVTGVEDAVKALLEAKQFLVGSRRPGPGDGGARTTAPHEGDLDGLSDPTQVREAVKKLRR